MDYWLHSWHQETRIGVTQDHHCDCYLVPTMVLALCRWAWNILNHYRYISKTYSHNHHSFHSSVNSTGCSTYWWSTQFIAVNFLGRGVNSGQHIYSQWLHHKQAWSYSALLLWLCSTWMCCKPRLCIVNLLDLIVSIAYLELQLLRGVHWSFRDSITMLTPN